jgi:hypothetical protein
LRPSRPALFHRGNRLWLRLLLVCAESSSSFLANVERIFFHASNCVRIRSPVILWLSLDGESLPECLLPRCLVDGRYHKHSSLWWSSYVRTAAGIRALFQFPSILNQVISEASFVCTIRHGLNLPVFFLKLALHFEIDLSFALDTLLFHVTDHALMHGLSRRSALFS